MIFKKKVNLIIMLFLLFIPHNLYAFTYTNASNIKLDNTSKVMGITVPANFMLYSFDAELIAGWNTPLYEHEKKYIPKKYHNLDILGGWYGSGNHANKEMLLTKNIDAAFYIGNKNVLIGEIDKYMKSIKIPFISITGSSIEEDIKIYDTLGNIFNNKKRSDEINAYIKKSLLNTKTIVNKVTKKKKVYLALGENGLRTRCVNSIVLAGAENVHKCSKYDETISFEQLLIYNPEVIIVGKKNAYKHIMQDKKWKKLKAVKSKQILFVPEEPFSWVEKKTVMEYFVIQFLSAKLYPEYADIDLHSLLIEHLKIFFHFDMDYNMADKLINYEKHYK